MHGDPLRKGRLGTGRPPAVAEFLSSMEADRWIAGADVLVDIAHLLMLRRQGIVGEEHAAAVLRALVGMAEDGVPETAFDDRYEDIHAGIEAHLIEVAGTDAGGRLHMGRSRNDEVATCLRIRLRREMLLHMKAVNSLRAVLLRRAAAHTHSVMPGFTHLQHAQPTTLAHHLLGYEQAFARDFERLRDAFARVDRCPLGAAAFASTGYPIDRAYAAGLLGFPALAENTMDAVSARDFALETLSAWAILMATASRLCEELIIWSSAFVDFVRLDDAYCSTSSIMPQKKNPDTAEILRAKTGTTTGALLAALTCMKGLPMSYNRDLQDLTPHLWRAAETVGRCLPLMSGMLDSATFMTARMHEEAGRGYSTATDLADVLVRDFGLPFRTAHGIVGRAVRMGSLTLATLETAAREMADISLVGRGVTDDVVGRALDVTFSVTSRNQPGGPAPEAAAASIGGHEERLAADRRWVEDTEERIDTALSELVRTAQDVVR
ncbi:MAG: argininosuccinate lyase [Methanoculleus sp. SDB]|nr:MAG: argininosuccinate lyase [Methanoculleus sp. SDB]